MGSTERQSERTIRQTAACDWSQQSLWSRVHSIFHRSGSGPAAQFLCLHERIVQPNRELLHFHSSAEWLSRTICQFLEKRIWTSLWEGERHFHIVPNAVPIRALRDVQSRISSRHCARALPDLDNVLLRTVPYGNPALLSGIRHVRRVEREVPSGVRQDLLTHRFRLQWLRHPAASVATRVWRSGPERRARRRLAAPLAAALRLLHDAAHHALRVDRSAGQTATAHDTRAPPRHQRADAHVQQNFTQEVAALLEVAPSGHSAL